MSMEIGKLYGSSIGLSEMSGKTEEENPADEQAFLMSGLM